MCCFGYLAFWHFDYTLKINERSNVSFAFQPAPNPKNSTKTGGKDANESGDNDVSWPLCAFSGSKCNHENAISENPRWRKIGHPLRVLPSFLRIESSLA